MKCDGVRIIGLTGGIASGKSSVARFFSDEGIVVIDADQLSRDAVSVGSEILSKIVSLFGESVLNADGTLNRGGVRTQVFADNTLRKQLEEILHPEIRRLAEERIHDAAKSGHRQIIYMAPLLIEAGSIDRVDEVWIVSVHPAIQLDRLMMRDSIGLENAQRIIGSQMPLAEKERYARRVIDNNGTLQETRCIVHEILKSEFGIST